MNIDKETDLKFWLAISKSNIISPKNFSLLISEFKSAQNIWKASQKSLRSFLSDKKIDSFNKYKTATNPDKLEDILIKLKITPISITDDNYPLLLKEISDPPIVLFAMGNISLLNKECLGIVGSRKATEMGKRVTFEMAKRIGEKGIVIVSGLAMGIDSQAHEGALASGGHTIAVLGNSLDHIYPASNDKLAKKIVQYGGTLVSEYFPFLKTEKYNFVARNRIISGLSKGVLVTEAANKSGALITADFALDQNRNVYSIPGDINSRLSMGTNNLLKSGAKIVTDPNDILEDYNLGLCQKQAIALEKNEKLIFDFLDQPKTLDEITDKLNINHWDATEAISLLELKGVIENREGQFYKCLNL
jgi:DNA processing protein